jgi:hypothetical protein
VSWQVKQGGSGFSPPYICPPAAPTQFIEDVPVTAHHKVYNIKASTAQKFLKSMPQRYQQPAKIFCSRELETKLIDFVRSELAAGRCPSDETLRAEARQILGTEQTAADEMQLLQKFKEMMGIAEHTTHLGDLIPSLDDSLLAEFDHEIGNMNLSNMDLSEIAIPASSNIQLMQTTPTPAPGLPPTPKTNQKQKSSKGEGLAQDYAELYLVHAATASPLRRRASSRMAAKAGYAFPPNSPISRENINVLGISPPRTTAALSLPPTSENS